MRATISVFLLLCSACHVKGSSNIGVDDTAATDSGQLMSADADGDGYIASEDCDDTNSQIHPEATELCDEIDNDCDGSIDEDVSQTFYRDGDSDSWGGDETLLSCTAPPGYIERPGDCDDGDAAVHPAATEICDPDGLAIDNDCDGLIDGEDDSLDPTTATTWYTDADGDGYGDADAPQTACSQPSATVSIDTDCDDANSEIHPEALEVCDGADNDCDGTTDGDIVFTAVSSTYTYQGTETLADLQKELSASPELCSTSLESTADFGAPLDCGTGSENTGAELAITFFLTEETAGSWSFRLGTDFGRGGALFVDGIEIAQSVDNLWWNYSWDVSTELLEGSVELEPGTHTFHAIGFEDCCGGSGALQYRMGAGDWAVVEAAEAPVRCSP